jgi:uncharacterized membrane protein
VHPLMATLFAVTHGGTGGHTGTGGTGGHTGTYIVSGGGFPWALVIAVAVAVIVVVLLLSMLRPGGAWRRRTVVEEGPGYPGTVAGPRPGATRRVYEDEVI